MRCYWSTGGDESRPGVPGSSASSVRASLRVVDAAMLSITHRCVRWGVGSRMRDDARFKGFRFDHSRMQQRCTSTTAGVLRHTNDLIHEREFANLATGQRFSCSRPASDSRCPKCFGLVNPVKIGASVKSASRQKNTTSATILSGGSMLTSRTVIGRESRCRHRSVPLRRLARPLMAAIA